MRDFKIDVEFNIGKSVDIQKLLFKQGHCWGGGSKEIDHTPIKYMFFSFDKIFNKKVLTCLKTDNKTHFDASELKEIDYGLFLLLN